MQRAKGTLLRNRHCTGVAASLLALFAASCDLPKDPNGTTDRVLATHELRAGVSENPPWVRFDGADVTGIEPDLIRAFATEMGAEVKWTRGSETPLLKALEGRELDIVAAGLTDGSPWHSRLATTRPYLEHPEKRVLFAAPGENQLLLRLDRFLASSRPQVDRARNETKP